jgi:hypothetical protein
LSCSFYRWTWWTLFFCSNIRWWSISNCEYNKRYIRRKSTLVSSINKFLGFNCWTTKLDKIDW